MATTFFGESNLQVLLEKVAYSEGFVQPKKIGMGIAEVVFQKTKAISAELHNENDFRMLNIRVKFMRRLESTAGLGLERSGALKLRNVQKSIFVVQLSRNGFRLLPQLLQFVSKSRYSIVNATKPGENFVGRIFRVLVTETNEQKKYKSKSLIFKASSTNRARKQMMGSDRLFRTESDMYDIILPELNDFLRKHGISEGILFPGTVRCLATESAGLDNDQADVIVLEDKKVDGFEIVDIKSGLDALQCRLVLGKLAMLHASSMAVDVLQPELSEKFKKLLDKNLWTADTEKALTDLKKGFYTGLGFLEEPYQKGNPVYDNLYKIYEDFHDDFLSCYDTPVDFSCIIHGDCWCNNILFKINESGISEDVCLLDFQTPKICSPVNDLASLLFLSTTKEVRDDHFEKLLQFYHEEVTKVLRAFNLDSETIFPWDLFQKHLRLYMRLGVVLSLFGLPVVMADRSEIQVDIHSSEGDRTMFSDTAKVTNPETLKGLKLRLNEIVTLAADLGYI